MWDGIAKEKSPDNLFFANMGGAIESGPNMKALEGIAYWYNCDNQGRGGDDTPIWGCTLQGRVCNAIMNGHTATNVTASYATGEPRWRNLHKSTEEAQMWMNETVASGIVPWYHFIGGEEGLGADRRWQQPGRDYFNWLAKHDAHLTNKASIADIAVVMGQRTQRFYRSMDMGDPMSNIHGIYYALLNALCELVPVGGRIEGRQILARVAVAFRHSADGRPCICKKPVDSISIVDLTHDGGHVLSHIGSEHAGLVESIVF
jgi:hypothetical protein